MRKHVMVMTLTFRDVIGHVTVRLHCSFRHIFGKTLRLATITRYRRQTDGRTQQYSISVTVSTVG